MLCVECRVTDGNIKGQYINLMYHLTFGLWFHGSTMKMKLPEHQKQLIKLVNVTVNILYNDNHSIIRQC